MNVDKVIARLREKCDDKELRRTARAVGDELSRNRVEVVNSFLAKACTIQPKDPYLKGYLEGLRDVARACNTVAHTKKYDLDLLAITKMSPGNGISYFRILSWVAEEKVVSLDKAAEHFQREVSQIHQYLDNLTVFHLLEGFDPYRVTLYGQRVLGLDQPKD